MNNPLKTTQKKATTLDFQNTSIRVTYYFYGYMYAANSPLLARGESGQDISGCNC